MRKGVVARKVGFDIQNGSAINKVHTRDVEHSMFKLLHFGNG